jgi:asparagine synthase (glutamine-hydrolysing)
MSAIVAAAARRLSEPTRRWIVEATAYSANAGPDRQAVALGQGWGLGHALLRVGPSEPEQPLTRDGRVWMTAAVRLDARAEVISSLRAHRQPVDAGASDPELLLAAYYAWGDAFLERLAGDFAFALWDGASGRLVCGRDQIGVIPLHYARAGDELLVASGLDALLLHPAVSDQLDEEALADFLVMGRGDFAATTFRSIRRLPPAHQASWVNRELRLRRYWRRAEWPPLLSFKTQEGYVSRFRDLLESAVAERATDDRLAVQMSGGMDSTSVAAFATKAMTKRGLPSSAIRGMTMMLGGDSGDQEGQYAELVARSLRIELEIVDESLLEPIDPFAAPNPPTPEPTPYRWSEMDYESVRRSAGHARLLLTGLPGDALLMFVPWYWTEWLARGRLLRLTRAFVDHARLFSARPHPHLKPSARHALAVSRRRAPATPGWLAPGFARRTAADDRARAFAIPRAIGLDVRSVSGEPFWSTLFLWSDPSFTRLPLRLRHPLADLRLLDFAARVPPEPWLVRKRILREATRDLLPCAVVGRPKTPLVRAARDTITPEVLERLAELVRALPDVDRLFDSRGLIDAITAPEAATEHPHDHQLLRALGLVHWRAHWRRPNASGLNVAGVRFTFVE